MTTTDYTCHACGADYEAPSIELDGTTFELCFGCRKVTPLLQITLGGDPEAVWYAAGIKHAVECILEDSYVEYQEFSDQEWKALEQFFAEGQHHYATPISRLQFIEDDKLPTVEEFQALVAGDVKALQELWEKGVESGILRANIQHKPGGEVFRLWPVKFQIEVREVKLEELIENGVVAHG